uniref:Uncharacterized protein n=4 Tax=Serratia marcescens TaxID=615 RepID=M4T4A5_SERMA|nr:hypothetical protein [Serratia marcescens]AGZ03784.1 hypothetical protein SME112820_25 [Serratia marcescens]AGZ03823.1 hypothetical protein SME10408_25 [Serratia marcescens]AGZ03858.1 hypothetical protein SME12620_25 [Serratia marcescens]
MLRLVLLSLEQNYSHMVNLSFLSVCRHISNILINRTIQFCCSSDILIMFAYAESPIH